MFKTITNISDIVPFVEDKKEIAVSRHPNGVVVVCYMFMDKDTFDSPEALEARGIAFNKDGSVMSRPLHKFFNVGEKASLSVDEMKKRNIRAVFEKIDGSMIATAWDTERGLLWRSKKSFNSSVVKLVHQMMENEKFAHIQAFAQQVASNGLTAVFELTHPDAQIVVKYPEPTMSLLHVRDNTTGEYVLLDPDHVIHQWVNDFGVTTSNRLSLSMEQVMENLETMTNQEGYVLQFDNGDMAKIKCPWYLRLHRSITFLRERDIAVAALYGQLDDIKGALQEVGIDLTEVEKVETRLKETLLGHINEVERVVSENAHLSRKEFAQQFGNHLLFKQIMWKVSDPTKEIDYVEWYHRKCLRSDFGLRVLADEALADEFDMRTPKEDTPKPFKP